MPCATHCFVIAACIALLYVIHLKRPSTQLNQLEDTIQQTEGNVRDAKLHCPRDLLSLTEGGLRLLEVKRSTSIIRCRMLETLTLTWKQYRILSRDISNCAKDLEKIRTAVQLVVEAERQRKYTDDINETQAMLTTLRPPGTLGYQHNITHAHEQSSMSVTEHPCRRLSDTELSI
ncbi:hypothetical protein FB451DRAFT_1389257 [Mycena latifolia]|nr:hypothetical protein FB451DRAFT_1389257 [Mycena latifolia]